MPRPDKAGRAAQPVVEKVVEYHPVRKRLPKRRPSQTISFLVGGAEGYLTAGSYPDDGLGELFLKFGKQGSTLGGIMDAFSIAVSIGLQYGVPLETFVEKFTNLRFEPAGSTDDPDIRMAQSIMDYVFRRLALDYLDFETRSYLGIHTAGERARHLETGSYAAPEDTSQEDIDKEVESSSQSVFRKRRYQALGGPVGSRRRVGPGGGPRRALLSGPAGRLPGQGCGRADLSDLRDQDAPGWFLLRLRRLRQHQRLQLGFADGRVWTPQRREPSHRGPTSSTSLPT